VLVLAVARFNRRSTMAGSEFPQRDALWWDGVLLVAQVIMFFSGLGWQHLIDPKAILPPLDRAYIIFGIIWITWLYAFPEPSRAADGSDDKFTGYHRTGIVYMAATDRIAQLQPNH
jgi:hypothetical protein